MTKQEFLKVCGNWNSHLPFLWQALEMTKHLKLPILELGSGMGSTAVLRQYCKDEGIEFVTYDDKMEYAKENDSIYVENWDTIPWRKDYGVALVDHAPGEHRKIAIQLLTNTKILVCHDTEPAADHGYQMRAELAKFKFMIDYKTSGAWASAVSNEIDVSLWQI